MESNHILLASTWQKFIWLLIFATCLGGCERFSSRFPVTEPYSYHVSYPSDAEFNFEDYVAFANHIAHQWDSQSNLESIARLTSCNTTGIAAGQQMLITYWRPRIYWFGQRIEWLEIVILPDEPLALVQASTSTGTTWDKLPVDPTMLTIDYSTATQMADEAGGIKYKTSHGSCFQRVVLVNNQWNFEYMEDRWGTSDGILRLCIDGITGEPCEFFYEHVPSGEDDGPPTLTDDIAWLD